MLIPIGILNLTNLTEYNQWKNVTKVKREYLNQVNDFIGDHDLIVVFHSSEG